MTNKSTQVPDWRPRLHFTAPEGWLNDPNGLVEVDGTWHLHYQFEWPRCWGHATSRDLFHWEHLPVALRPDENGDCWSGGTVHDRNNTSGLFAGAEGGLVSVYTSQDAVKGQRISLACSDDGGRTWWNFPGNPILSRQQRDCRDPKVFWDADRKQWAMVLTEAYHLTFFVSPNLREWRETSRFTPRPAPGIDGYECPDLFSLPVEGQPGKSKWVLASSYVNGANFTEPPGYGVCSQRYYVGEFDGGKFTAETGEERLLQFGDGPDEYAAIVWPRETGGARRTLVIGWMNHWGYAKQIPTSPWQGCLTLPRELTLHELAPGEWQIRQAPARELWTLPHARKEFPAQRLTREAGVLQLGQGRCGAIRATLRPAGDAVVEFAIFAQGEFRTVAGYDAARKLLYFDRLNSGSPEFHASFSLRKDAPLALDADGRLELVIVFDRSTVEIFGGGGAVYIAGQTFPDPTADAVNLKVGAGAVMIERLAWLKFEEQPV